MLKLNIVSLLTIIFVFPDYSPDLMKILHKAQTLAYILKTLKHELKIDICYIIYVTKLTEINFPGH